MGDRLAILQTQESINELKKLEDSIKSVIRTTKDLIKNANQINKALKSGTPKEYTRAIKELNTATRDFNKSQMQMATQLTRITKLERQVAQMLREQSRAIRDVANATRDESRAREAAERIATQQQRTARESANTQAAENRASREAANALNAESRARQQATRESRQNERQNRENASAHAQLTRQVREARQRARDYGAQIANLDNQLRAGTITQREYRAQITGLQRNFRNSTSEAIRLERQLRNLNQATLPSGQRNGALLGRVTDIVKGMGIANILENTASAFFNMGEKALQTAIKLDTLRLAQLSVFKTNAEVSKQNLFLVETSDRYGIEILGLTDAYTKFAASSNGTLLEGKKTQEIFDAVTRSSSLLGVSSDETTGILKALGQMMSKGKVQAEELRGQLGDRMAGAFKLFADGMGISTAQLDKMLKDGEVLAEEVLPKFATQLNKKYTLGLGEEIETNQANLNRMSNEWVNFVEAVETKSGIVAGSIKGISVVVTDLLKLLSPSKEVTLIEQQQQQFNELGVELRQNWKDQNARKEVMDKMIEINPLFLNGLDREKASLEEISKRIQDVNAQYFQKIILQEKEDEITELIKDQALNFKRISEILSENAQRYNAAGNEAKDAIDKFASGTINYEEALKRVYKEEGISADAKHGSIRILNQLKQVYNESRGSVFNYVGSIKSNNEAISRAKGEHQGLINTFNKFLDKQVQVINMNGKLALSYNPLNEAVINQRKVIEEQLKVAEGQGRKYALINNVWREQDAKTGKWKTTNKRQDANNNIDLKGQSTGWYLEGGELVQRKIQVLEKETKKKAATLSAAQKDFINTSSGIRDKEIAVQKQRKLDLLISEEDYWIEYEKITERYNNKIQGYLKGSNAKEVQVEGAAFKRAVDAREQSTKELYDIRSKRLEEQNKIEQNINDRGYKAIEEDQYLSEVQKLNQQIEIDNKAISQLDKYYKTQIETAKKAGESVIAWERKRDDEIGKIQDERNKRINTLPEAFNNDIDSISELSNNLQNKDYEEQRLQILQRKMALRDKEFLLNSLELGNQKNQLLNERNTLELKKSELDRLSESGKLTKEQLSLYGEIKGQISNINSEIEVTNQSLNTLQFERIAEGLQPVVDFISDGLNDLGLDAISNQFTKMYQKILAEGKNFSMSTREIFEAATAVISDFAQQFNEAQKNSTISALDEQLKYTQDTTEQEIEFINQRLERLNSLDELNAEQIAQRNQLEDEARTLKEQQAQREKQIETQKARAEQKAAAQQALINGALAATMTLAQMGFIAGAIPAALALGFGIAQSVAIMAKDPVPKYFVGRNGGKAEYAITQDGGRELITDKKGNIKSLGSDNGDKLTWLDEGDNVHTAKETKSILQRMVTMPQIGENVFRKIALQSMIAPTMTIVNKSEIDYDKLADKMGAKFENSLKRYTHPTTERINGKIIRHRGANLGEIIGYYDQETGNEIIKQDDTN